MGSPSSRLLFTDGASSVYAWTGERPAYSPFGVSISVSPGAGLGFIGHRREFTAGYSLGNGKRFYLQSLARFSQPDALSPFGKGGMNASIYCSADPINRRDPSGESAYGC